MGQGQGGPSVLLMATKHGLIVEYTTFYSGFFLFDVTAGPLMASYDRAIL